MYSVVVGALPTIPSQPLLQCKEKQSEKKKEKILYTCTLANQALTDQPISKKPSVFKKIHIILIKPKNIIKHFRL